MVSGDTSPLRNNLKGDVRKKTERDKREETMGYKKLSKQVAQGQIFMISFVQDMYLLKSTQALNW